MLIQWSVGNGVGLELLVAPGCYRRPGFIPIGEEPLCMKFSEAVGDGSVFICWQQPEMAAHVRLTVNRTKNGCRSGSVFQAFDCPNVSFFFLFSFPSFLFYFHFHFFHFSFPFVFLHFILPFPFQGAENDPRGLIRVQSWLTTSRPEPPPYQGFGRSAGCTRIHDFHSARDTLTPI